MGISDLESMRTTCDNLDLELMSEVEGGSLVILSL